MASDNRITVTDVIEAYRDAQIAARESDEDDDEAISAWRVAYLVHIAYDPSLKRGDDGK